MKNSRCPGCGLVNFATQQTCKRCNAPLRRQDQINSHAEKSHSSGSFEDTNDTILRHPNGRALRLWANRTSIIIAAVSLVVISAAAFALINWRHKSPPPYAELIQTAPAYHRTATILINRQNETRRPPFPDPQLQGMAQPRPRLLPETLMLYHAGFLVFHETGSPEVSTNLFFIMNEFTIEPKSKEIENQWTLLERSMSIGNSQTNISRQWWIVPIGEREFGQITAASEHYDGAGGNNYVEIEFKWRWKPNEVGRALDASDPNYTSPENIIGVGNWSPADSQRMIVRSSKDTYDGHAKLLRKADGSYTVVDVQAEFAKQH